jgi:hypothetical protein
MADHLGIVCVGIYPAIAVERVYVIGVKKLGHLLTDVPIYLLRRSGLFCRHAAAPIPRKAGMLGHVLGKNSSFRDRSRVAKINIFGDFL